VNKAMARVKPEAARKTDGPKVIFDPPPINVPALE